MSTETKFRITKKVCRCCGERKAVEEFYAYPKARDGRQSWCKGCIAAAAKRFTRKHGHRQSEFGPAHRAKWAAIAAEAAASE